MAPPWKDAQGSVVDPALERVYNDTALHIRAPHTYGEVVQRYNFPTENLQGGEEEIMSHIEDIYREQNNEFGIYYEKPKDRTVSLLHTLCQFILVSNTLYNYQACKSPRLKR